jgi:hypothetical protein
LNKQAFKKSSPKTPLPRTFFEQAGVQKIFTKNTAAANA